MRLVLAAQVQSRLACPQVSSEETGETTKALRGYRLAQQLLIARPALSHRTDPGSCREGAVLSGDLQEPVMAAWGLVEASGPAEDAESLAEVTTGTGA